MSKWIAEFDLEDGDTMPEHMDLEYKGAKIDFHCKPLEHEPCEDAISRQAVLDEIEKLKKIHFDRTVVLNKVRDRIIYLPSVQPKQKTGHWIPVSERLPEEETDVLICNGNGDIKLSRGSYSTEVENDFIWYTSGWRFGKVIAWMPLPTPFEPQESEE